MRVTNCPAHRALRPNALQGEVAARRQFHLRSLFADNTSVSVIFYAD